jgi:hypothetical protein
MGYGPTTTEMERRGPVRDDPFPAQIWVGNDVKRILSAYVPLSSFSSPLVGTIFTLPLLPLPYETRRRS